MIGRSSGEAAYSVKWLGRSPSFNISSEWKTPPLVSMSNAKQFLHKPLCASRPNELWCWDITWLPGPIRGKFFYLYLIMDVYSRKIVGHEVYTEESAEHASSLMTKAMLAP